MGYTSAQSQLLTIPPYAVATIFTVFWAILSERYKRRGLFIIITTTVAIIGYIILITNKDPTAKPGVSYTGTFFAAIGIYPSVALVLSWPAINVSGQTKRATANAMQISIGNCGAVLGTQLYRPNTMPRYILGHSFALGYLIANLVVVSILWWILTKENKQKQEYLAAHPETNGFHDTDEDLKLGDRHPRWHFNIGQRRATTGLGHFKAGVAPSRMSHYARWLRHGSAATHQAYIVCVFPMQHMSVPRKRDTSTDWNT